MSNITKKELMEKLKALGKISKEQRNSIVCSLIGHSLIQTTFFGYYNCGRCGNQLGDSLASIYPAVEVVVIVGHNCDTRQENYKKLTWRDKLYAPTHLRSPVLDMQRGRRLMDNRLKRTLLSLQ